MSIAYHSSSSISLSDVQGALPAAALYGTDNQGETAAVGWQLSPIPYGLTASQVKELHQIGACLYQFTQAIDQLYKACQKKPELAWLQSLFHAGKPQQLITFSQMNRFKRHLPWVIRPDLLVTPNGFSLCEIDAVPGGIGFTGALHQAYQSLGFPLIGSPEGIPKAFLEMLLQAATTEHSSPTIAVVVSDEASDYRKELTWLVETIQGFYPHIVILHPKSITLERNRLGYINDDNRFIPIDIIYRFFELFDLPNIPQIELIQYAVKKGLVLCTPPFKPHLEEKFTLALIHMPVLEPFWLETLGDETLSLLKTLIPESWMLDPAPVPPHAQVTPPLVFQGRWLPNFQTLTTLTQKQRELVIKPSGFSPLAWGSRGVSIGHDLSQSAWQEVLTEAFNQFLHTPHVMQRFELARIEPYTVFAPETGDITQHEGRTRLCPYYFVKNDTAELVGILATTCPKDKKVIHGMRDGVMRPAMLIS